MGKIETPKGVLLTPLKKIHHPKGDIFHAIKASEESFNGFGEAYFTTIYAHEVKGWKKHLRMHMNLIVVQGDVRFYLHDEAFKKTYCYEIGDSNYHRLTIPCGYWVAFEGLSKETTNLVLNVASIEHEPDEALNVSIDTFCLS